MSDFSAMTAQQLALAIRRGEADVIEVAEAAIASAEADTYGAFASVDADHALRSASRAKQMLADGDQSPLLGVPCPIKDLTEVAGLPFERGSRAFAGNIGARDDGIVTRLAQAGTVMIGKTSTPEFGLPCYTEPDTGPPAVTPWDPRRTAGGSSGGAGAAVAAGIVPVAHGSDGGGSIRIPAACCGLVGLKPSRGVISAGPYHVDGPGLVTNGFLTTTVADTALALDAVATGWPGDHFPGSGGGFLDALVSQPTNLRVGLLTDPVVVPATQVHPEAITAAEITAALLAELGHQVEPVSAPVSADEWVTFSDLWAVAAAAVPVPADAEELLRPLTKHLRTQGRQVSGVAIATAIAQAQLLERQVAEAWADFDLIVSPTLAQPPALTGSLRDDAYPAADFLAQTAFTPWTSLYNLVGRPAISLPLHRAVVDGVELPFGAMLGAAAWQDKLLLAVARQLEEIAPWPLQRSL